MIKAALSQSPNKVNLHPLSSKIITFVLLVAEAVIPLMLLLVTSQLAAIFLLACGLYNGTSREN